MKLDAKKIIKKRTNPKRSSCQVERVVRLHDINLRRCFEAFTEEMKKRLAKKEDEGFEGWDNNTNLHLAQRAKTKVHRLEAPSDHVDVKDAIDVANLMMMLWYRLK
jgi:hypothetical protein